ncbi:MAG: PAS domain-containing protein [Cyclobacteriaceae bacterium]|nr:PAS domain-containing protein [Cyclobacteriaceae bacterium]
MPGYAQYILDNKLSEYAHLSLKISRELDIPLLRYFSNFSEEQLIGMSMERNRETMQLLVENRASEIIETTTKNWITNQLPMIQRDQIVTEDIVLVSFMRRKVLRDLLIGYAKDILHFTQVMEEVDRWTMIQDTTMFNVFIRLQQEKINDTHAALQRREQELLEAQEIGQIGSFEWDLAGKNSIYTPQVYKIFEFDRPESMESFMNDVYPDDREKLSKAMTKGFEVGHFDCEYRYKRKTDKVLWTRGKVLYDGTKPVKVVGTVMDITERSAKTQQLASLNESLEHTNAELQRTNKELESFNFVASHDLQEPLRKIRIFGDRMLNASDGLTLPPTTRGYAEKMHQAAGRMQKLIDDFLSFSRTVASPKIFEPVDLSALLEDVKNDLAEMIKEKNVRIHAARLPVLNIIPFQFRQLLINLISNSIKYSKEGVQPMIRIDVERVAANQIDVPGIKDYENYFKLSISDNGIGFEQKYADKIFELFQRLHSKDNYSGTGIGLSICKKIVDSHDGFITARGIPGEGAEFDIYLPLRQSE